MHAASSSPERSQATRQPHLPDVVEGDCRGCLCFVCRHGKLSPSATQFPVQLTTSPFSYPDSPQQTSIPSAY